jgi:hypothetical protein
MKMMLEGPVRVRMRKWGSSEAATRKVGNIWERTLASGLGNYGCIYHVIKHQIC